MQYAIDVAQYEEFVTQLDELTEQITKKGPTIGRLSDKSSNDNSMPDVLVLQHDVPSPTRDTRLVSAADISASRHV